MFEHFLDDERIWDLLALDTGEMLLTERGLLAIDLLFGYPQFGRPAYPPRLHDQVTQILLKGNETTILALQHFRAERRFHRLLERSLPAGTLVAAIEHLFANASNYVNLLNTYDRLSDTALIDEVGPPPTGLVTWIPFYYTVYEVPKKLLQGREINGGDCFDALLDPAFLVVDLYSMGSASAVKSAIKGSKQVMRTTLRNSSELAAKSLGHAVSRNLTREQLLKWTITQAISNAQTSIAHAFRHGLTADITRPVQFMFGMCGSSAKTCKYLTGLEARLFMRQDARVTIHFTHLPSAIANTRLGQVLIDTSLNALAESESVQSVLAYSLRGALENWKGFHDEMAAWREQVSLWWLLHAEQVDLTR
jgi:hypothetical protein